jgi:hypothetical protein
VHLVLTNPATADTYTFIVYDQGPAPGKPDVQQWKGNGRFDSGEKPFADSVMMNDPNWEGNSRIFLYKEQGTIPSPAYEGSGIFIPAPPRWCVVCAASPKYEKLTGKQWNPSWGIRHEVGHTFGLATRNEGGAGHHDSGPPPPGTDMLMLPRHPNPEPIWMRHEDWQKANDTAKGRAQSE